MHKEFDACCYHYHIKLIGQVSQEGIKPCLVFSVVTPSSHRRSVSRKNSIHEFGDGSPHCTLSTSSHVKDDRLKDSHLSFWTASPPTTPCRIQLSGAALLSHWVPSPMFLRVESSAWLNDITVTDLQKQLPRCHSPRTESMLLLS